MPDPVSRRELIERLRTFGFTGPFEGAKHQIMKKGELKLRVPNPHQGDIGRHLLSEILRQAGINVKDWRKK